MPTQNSTLSEIPGEKCGIVGVFGEGMEAARLVHTCLWSLQHRGQESSGISSSEGTAIRIYKGTGLVSHVYDEEHLQLLSGYIAIGHNRYSTSGASTLAHTQPVMDEDRLFTLAHNGNLPDTSKLETFLTKHDIDPTPYNDSELMYQAIKYYLQNGNSIESSIRKAFPLFTGVFCLLIMTKDKMIAIRDAKGVRPLALGKLNGGYVIASETCALDTISTQYIRDIAPGEMIVVDKNGLKSFKLAKAEEKLDIFEFVYFARPDSILLGKRVNEVRRNLGIHLAKEFPIKADVVIPIPDSAIPAALGYSKESGIPFDMGLIKNRYIHRTFIRPAQKLREHDVTMKLNPVSEIIQGKDVIVIDDSIVRGTTSRKIVEMIRSAGATKVHLLISSPPVVYPDFYGIDTPKQDDLIASRMSVKKICEFIGADSLYFLSYKGLIQSTELPEKVFCTSCFTGIYPVDIGNRKKEVKSV
jgi:amidophosphoribosyltransferase